MLDAPGPRIFPRLLAALLAFGCWIAAGCDRTAADFVAGAETQAADTVAELPELPPSEPLPERIYFQLTDYDWYAHGEPLVHADAAYQLDGGVVAAPTSAMRKIGEYQGVDIYAAEGSTPDSAVYVPVFPGYWQPFHRTGAVTPAVSGS